MTMRACLPRPPARWAVGTLLASVLLLACGSPARAGAGEGEPVTRWYELLRAGRKVGWSSVTWTPGTWQGQPAVHDRTETRVRTARDMAGTIDVFDARTEVDLQRGLDGSLWEQRIVVHEGGRSSEERLRWTGSGYEHVAEVDGQQHRTQVVTDQPVSADMEACLSARVQAGTLAVGERVPLRELDVAGRRVRTSSIEVLGREAVEGEAGPVDCLKVVVREPDTGSETWLWLDAQGVFVQSLSDTGYAQRRASAERAQQLGARPPSFAITVRSQPPLERVMSADRLWVELLLEDDPARKLPDLPASPWGTVGAPQRAADGRWRIEALLARHAAPGTTTPLPIDPAPFARELEPPPLMPCGHPDLRAAAREAVDGAGDARTAVGRLARWVFESLEKESLEVAQGSALDILAQRKGDCSEHALLFVALCRAAGIPARRCSGWVCVGSDWGGHAWAEAWVGAWIGVDPTTGEVEPAARYLFFGHPDDPASHPGVASARVDGRLALRCTALEEDGVRLALEADDAGQSLAGEQPARWFLHVPSGIELYGLPPGWTAEARRTQVVVSGPGLQATLSALADQGQQLPVAAVGEARFAGRPALLTGAGRARTLVVQARRRFLRIRLRVDDEAQLPVLERLLAPTLDERVRAPGSDPRAARAAEVAVRWTLEREGTLEAQAARMLLGLPAEAHARMRARVEALAARLEATLELRADGTWSLAMQRPLAQGYVARDLEGTWSWGEQGLALLPQGTGRTPLAATLDGDGRLQVEHEGWPLLLRRMEGAR
ncbi:MAG: transglutaminase domain-containing protein [Planctomycetia bacterium]